MNLTVVFEHWHLGDGNYPAFAIGDEARLSFELDVTTAETVEAELAERVDQVRDAEYEIVGRVIRHYPDGVSSTFPVLEADWLRFYCPASSIAGLAVGTKVRMRGRLALDHYQWVEFLERYPDAPDLFYGVRVSRVRQVEIPERFVHRSARSVSHPTAAGPDEYEAAAVRDVPAVSEDSVGPAFSLLDLTILPAGAGPTHPTFIEA
jgi:hypothetical protein